MDQATDHRGNGVPQKGVDDPLGATGLSPEWRAYFKRLLESPRFAQGREFLRRDIAQTLQRVVAPDARVLEVGIGAGHVLASLPNAVRHGIDLLPEAVE